MSYCITVSVFCSSQFSSNLFCFICIVVELICKSWVFEYKTLFIIGEGVLCVFIAIFLRLKVSFIPIITRYCSLKNIWHSLAVVIKVTHNYCTLKLQCKITV